MTQLKNLGLAYSKFGAAIWRACVSLVKAHKKEFVALYKKVVKFWKKPGKPTAAKTTKTQ